MTETTRIEINSLADVESVDPATDNRYAVRALRHGARNAIFSAATELNAAKHSLTALALASTSLGCTGSETRENWLALLTESPERIDAGIADAKAKILAALDGLNVQAELAKSACKRAVAVLEAHPEGLPESSTEGESFDADDEDGEDD